MLARLAPARAITIIEFHINFASKVSQCNEQEANS